MIKLKSKILSGHNKATCDEIVHWIGTNQARFDELMRHFISGDKLLRQRAGWPLSYSAIANPGFIKKHLGILIANLKKKDLHDAEKRNTIRLLQEVHIPEKFQGDVMNICFDFIISPEEKPAIKAFSLTVLENLSTIYPDIKAELKTIIEDRWEFETAAFRARGRKILKKL